MSKKIEIIAGPIAGYSLFFSVVAAIILSFAFLMAPVTVIHTLATYTTEVKVVTSLWVYIGTGAWIIVQLCEIANARKIDDPSTVTAIIGAGILILVGKTFLLSVE